MEINEIIEKCKWRFAVTYANSNPHEYIVKGKMISEEDYDFLCEYIKNNSHKEYFFGHPYYYCPIGEYTYWVMGDIINRRWDKIYYVDDKRNIKKVDNWKELTKEKWQSI